MKEITNQRIAEIKLSLPPQLNENVRAFAGIALHLTQLYARKNMDYGDSFGKSVRRYGNVAALTRISDKFNRLENLVLHPDENLVADEKLQDTLLDLAAYAIMFAATMKEGNHDEK